MPLVDHSIDFWGWQLWMVLCVYIKPVDPNTMDLLPNFLHCEVFCLYMAGCYAGGNSIPKHQGLAKLLDIGAGWGSVGRKGKPIPRTDLHTSDDEWTAGLPGWKGPDIVDFPPCGLLVSSRNRAIFWAQRWYLLLAHGTFRGSSS